MFTSFKKNPNTFISAFLLVSSMANAEVNPTIIGGSAADPIAWPWMAGLVNKTTDVLFCGASLIAEDWVLTAGHCVINEKITNLGVIINQNPLESTQGERISVSRIILHPLFNNRTFDNDLALLKLTKSSLTRPIKLLSPYTFQDNAGKPAIALGWGTLSTTSEIFPTKLQQVDLPIIDNLECSVAMDGITDNMLCAGNLSKKKDTCLGDSGGPLIVFDNESHSWRQAGITSWGLGCAEPDSYGVYTRIKKFALFIADNICSKDEIPDPVILSLGIDNNRATAMWDTPKKFLKRREGSAYKTNSIKQPRTISPLNRRNSVVVSPQLTNEYGFRLNYSAFPDAQIIHSIDMNQSTRFSVALESGDAYYVAITRYAGNCINEFSNIENFTID